MSVEVNNIIIFLTCQNVLSVIFILLDYLGYVAKYRRFEKRHSNMPVHVSPCFINVSEGDVVTIGQCRPLAKTVKFNVLEHQPSVNKSLNVKKIFRVF